MKKIIELDEDDIRDAIRDSIEKDTSWIITKVILTIEPGGGTPGQADFRKRTVTAEVIKVPRKDGAAKPDNSY